jgi:hypothetical protein
LSVLIVGIVSESIALERLHDDNDFLVSFLRFTEAWIAGVLCMAFGLPEILTMDGWNVLYYCLELDDSQIVISPRLMRLVKFTLHAEASNVNPNTYLGYAPPNVSIEPIVQREIPELLHLRNPM